MTNPITSLVNYLRSAKAELEKVSWPSRQETMRYSVLVCAVCIVTAVFFAALDFGLGFGVDQLLGVKGGAQTAPATTPQPVTPDLAPSVEAIDSVTGQPIDVNVKTLPLDDGAGTFKINE